MSRILLAMIRTDAAVQPHRLFLFYLYPLLRSQPEAAMAWHGLQETHMPPRQLPGRPDR